MLIISGSQNKRPADRSTGCGFDYNRRTLEDAMRRFVAFCLLALALPASSRAAQAAAAPAKGASAVPPSLERLSHETEALVARVVPAVVQVLATGYNSSASGTSPGLLTRQRSSGSGVIVDPDGYVITNAHVAAGAVNLEVLLANTTPSAGRSILRPPGQRLPAQVVGLDLETDVAVLKIEAKGLPALPLADSDELKQGQVVLAFGSPLGFENSVTMGVVSALARQLKPEDPMIYLQTDAAINPGNSGGPLVDVQGRIVGLCTLIVSQSGGNEGLGFAAPSSIVKSIYEQIRSRGRVRRGWIGVHAQTITPLLAAGLGLSQNLGVIVGDVAPEGPAAAAGLRAGDVVLRADGRPLDNARQLGLRLYRHAPGETVTLAVERGPTSLTLAVSVVERPFDPDRFFPTVTPDHNLVPRLGILGIELEDDIRKALPNLRFQEGVLVVARASGEGGEESLQPGDVIYFVNGVSVRGLVELREAVARVPALGAIVLQVERKGQLTYLAVEAE
jgi:serine protease Do